jgi:hypothetical protein
VHDAVAKAILPKTDKSYRALAMLSDYRIYGVEGCVVTLYKNTGVTNDK